MLWKGAPGVDPTANALRPRNSPAYAGLEEVQNLLSQRSEPLWLVVGGLVFSAIYFTATAADLLRRRGTSLRAVAAKLAAKIGAKLGVET